MKPIIFVKIAHMKYYNGTNPKDIPYQKSSFIEKNKDGSESNNFTVYCDDDSNLFCLGFVQNGERQINIENIIGCDTFKDADKVSGVHVVFFSKAKNDKCFRVVGFYKNATVYRRMQVMNILKDDNYVYKHYYSFRADLDDCVLLPLKERKNKKWLISTGKRADHNVINPGKSPYYLLAKKQDKTDTIKFIEDKIKAIESYNGFNLCKGE